MNNRQTLAVTITCLLIAGLAVVWWIGRPTSDVQQQAEKADFAKASPLPVATSTNQEPKQEKDAAAQPAENKMSDLEFKRLKVGLPAPVNEQWRGPFFDSRSCFDPDKKQTAVDVLPVWIRQALLANKPEMAARYLWSLMKLSEDKELPTATKAAFAIYRLGDYNGAGAAAMRGWIESGVNFRYSDALTGSNESKDIRAQVLEELQLHNDRSLDQSIYETWLRNQAAEGKELAAVDYAYHLEKNGRELPAGYWAQRLDNPHGFANALEIAERKGTPQVTAKLQGLFEELRAKPAASADAGRAASVASALFRQTGEASYRDYLVEQARAQLASGSFESSLPKVLEGLAGAKDKAALEIVSGAMKHDNEVVGEMAIDALGKSRDPAAAELLFEAAIQKAKEGKGFPAREMRALLAQDDPSADSKYERLQQALLSGQLGWTATTSDFASLEFFRKHGRQ